MKAKVLKRFKDKYTKEIKETGELIEISMERYKELTTSPLGIFIEKLETESETICFDNMTKKELMEYAKQKNINLDMSMTKQEMIKELI